MDDKEIEHISLRELSEIIAGRESTHNHAKLNGVMECIRKAVIDELTQRGYPIYKSQQSIHGVIQNFHRIRVEIDTVMLGAPEDFRMQLTKWRGRPRLFVFHIDGITYGIDPYAMQEHDFIEYVLV